MKSIPKVLNAIYLYVKKINQKKKPKPVLKKEKLIRVRKTKMQKKKQGLNGRSFDLLLRKLLVALKG